MADERPTPEGSERRVRRALSQAEHHRRRRRVAAAALGAVLLVLTALVATSAGSGGTWDPERLRNGAVAELPKLRLQEQADKAAKALAARKRERALEVAAVERTREQTPFIRVAGDQQRRVALTFDDGPSPYTQRILDTLKRGDAKATFFVLGNQLAEHPIPLQRAVAEGHEIADHSWNHADLTTLAPRDIGAQMSDVGSALKRVGIPEPTLFRPPYGAFDERVLRQAGRRDRLTVMWTIDTGDYKATDPQAMADQVLAQASPGAIILMHDGGGNRTVTGKALPLIVRGLKADGYEMVTVSQLLLGNPPPAEQETVARTPVA
ncbi:MAG: polysaccharide deacetylase family protein [Solirubrobacteraceae bacterium]|nr:polysaccharide deacetylase family protein [Solirubrobacteraceae bacterium]